jgi:hypothetical protein
MDGQCYHGDEYTQLKFFAFLILFLFFGFSSIIFEGIRILYLGPRDGGKSHARSMTGYI